MLRKAFFVLKVGAGVVLELLFRPSSVLATTLMITHPDTKYDLDSSGGPGTRQLLEDPQYCRRLLLLGTNGDRRLTFNPQGLQFETILSHGGELAWDNSDFDVVIGGGHFNMCQMRTITNLIQFANQDLMIRVSSNATYCLHEPSVLSLGLSPKHPFTDARSITLANFRQTYGLEAFRRLILDMVPYIYQAIPLNLGIHPGRSVHDLQLLTLIDGSAWRFGSGRQTVVLTFD